MPAGVPIGTIVAWLPFLNRESPTFNEEFLSNNGWMVCDGDVITDPNSPWQGENTPNLYERYC